MPENSLVLFVFLSQVLLLSFYLPLRLVRIVQYVVEKYPPSQYGKLYPVSGDEMLRARHIYVAANLLIGLIGLGLVFHSFYSPSKEMLNWDTQSVIGFYFMLQFSPWIIITVNPGFTFFNLARKPQSVGTRTATLERRRLFEFVSPKFVGLAAAVYVAFVAFVLAAPEVWGAGYWNILFVTLMNVFFAGSIGFLLHGKKRDPYQAHEDRLAGIGNGIRLQIFGSIAATLFLSINAGLQSFGTGLQDVAQSVYFQLLAIAVSLAHRVDNINFEVYKGAAQVNTESRESIPKKTGVSTWALFVFVVTFVMFFIIWEHRDQMDVPINGSDGSVGERLMS